MKKLTFIALAACFALAACRKQETAEQIKAKANAGDPVAMFELGKMFLSGDRVTKQNGDGICYLERAVLSGNANALAFIKRGAESGNPALQFALWEMYRDAIGVQQSQKEALKWLNKSNGAGYAAAKEMLQRLAFGGNPTKPEDVPSLPVDKAAGPAVETDPKANAAALAAGRASQKSKDLSKAADFFRQAAQDGNAEAQYRFGWALVKGEGIEKEPRLGLRWMLKSANQGNPDAQTFVGASYSGGNPELGVTKNKQEAFKWLRLAADQGNKGGLLLVTLAYANGDGVVQDSSEAWHYCFLFALAIWPWLLLFAIICVLILVGFILSAAWLIRRKRKSAQN